MVMAPHCTDAGAGVKARAGLPGGEVVVDHRGQGGRVWGHDAAWIADTGRFADSLKTCEFSEVEPFPQGREVIVGRSAVIDAVEIDRCQLQQK